MKGANKTAIVVMQQQLMYDVREHEKSTARPPPPYIKYYTTVADHSFIDEIVMSMLGGNRLLIRPYNIWIIHGDNDDTLQCRSEKYIVNDYFSSVRYGKVYYSIRYCCHFKISFF